MDKKKILIIGFDRFDCLEWNICDTFKRMGLECKILDPYARFPFNFRFKIQTLLRSSSNFESIFWNRFVKSLKGKVADLTISTLQNLPPEFVDKIRNILKSPIIQWNPDPLYSYMLNRDYIIYGSYNLLVVEFPYIYHYLNNMLGKDAIQIPEAFNPYIHTPPSISKLEAEKKGVDILIAGTLYYERAYILEELMDYNIELYGNYPKWLKSPVLKYCKNKYLVGKEKAKKFFSSRICLNTVHYSNIDGTNCRLFEIAGSGGFQISEYREEIPKYFETDKEIVFYRSVEELKDKIDYYLKHPEERWKIAKAGRKRAMEEHTWEHRIKYLLFELRKRGLIKNERE